MSFSVQFTHYANLLAGRPKTILSIFGALALGIGDALVS
jgi:hypothetical protein